jgi:hypothetical protein
LDKNVKTTFQEVLHSLVKWLSIVSLNGGKGELS